MSTTDKPCQYKACLSCGGLILPLDKSKVYPFQKTFLEKCTINLCIVCFGQWQRLLKTNSTARWQDLNVHVKLMRRLGQL